MYLLELLGDVFYYLEHYITLDFDCIVVNHTRAACKLLPELLCCILDVNTCISLSARCLVAQVTEFLEARNRS